MRTLNVLFALAYALLGLWIGLWLLVAWGVAEAEDGGGWQGTVLTYLGLASLPLVVLAVVFTYLRWRLGVALVCAHLGLLAVAVRFAARIPNWDYLFVVTWFVLIVVAAVGFLLTRRAVNARSSGVRGTPVGQSA